MTNPRHPELPYSDKVRQVARWYETHQAANGGWPMQWAETEDLTKPPGLVSTAYGLALLRYARIPFHDTAVQRGLEFILASSEESWRSTRSPVYTILALSEWPDALIDGTTTARIEARDVRAKVEKALSWLDAHRIDGGWPVSDGGHRCIAWTSKVVYALGRLRLRSTLYRAHSTVQDLLEEGVSTLLGTQILEEGARRGSWLACGANHPSVANTALAVIALSHRHVESAAPPSKEQLWRDAYVEGANWLLANHSLWEENESGEDDPAAHDGWQYAVFSLAPRACLSAGYPPEHPFLARGLNFAFDRWRRGPIPGWGIYGKGVTAYSSWSVVQVGQVLRLAISREDPMRVLRALQNGPTATEKRPELIATLDPAQRTVQLELRGFSPRVLNMGGQSKRFRLLEAFAQRKVPPGGQLSLEVLDQFVHDRLVREGVDSRWNAMKALAHETNEAVRSTLEEESARLFSSTTRSGRAIVALGSVRLGNGETDAYPVSPRLPEDVSAVERT